MRLRDIIFKFMSPQMRAAVEADSRRYVATCPRCQKTSSIWDIGGVRYKAVGRPVSLAWCPHCSKASFMRFEKPADHNGQKP